MAHGIPEVNFGRGPSFRLGVEEELLLVDPHTHALSHSGTEVLARLEDGEHGRFAPDTYEAEIELKSPVSATAGEAIAHLAAMRHQVHESGAAAIGTGLHPAAAFGDVVHVGMPDAATAILAFNGLRRHLPLLQALSANSPYWYGIDSGFDSARAQVFREYPRSEIPRAFRGFDDYARTIEKIVNGAEIADYTFLWWDVRPHPNLGTVEVRAMDAQSDLRSIAGLSALIHGLAIDEVASPRPAEDQGVLEESSFRAARDGLKATIWFDGALRPVPEVAQRALRNARRHMDLPELEEVERIVREGNGADRRRAAFQRGGMPAVLSELVADFNEPSSASGGLAPRAIPPS